MSTAEPRVGVACPRPLSQWVELVLEPWSPHPHLLSPHSTHCESERKWVKHKPDNAEQKRNERQRGPEKSRMKIDNWCSVDSADTEGDVARDGLRPGRLCVSTGMGPRRHDHYPIAGPLGHGRLRKSAHLNSKIPCLSGTSRSMWKLESTHHLGFCPMDTPCALGQPKQSSLSIY